MVDDDSEPTDVIRSTDTLAVGDCLYAEQIGRLYWVEELDDGRAKLVDTEGRTDAWVLETLEKSFQAQTWIRQSDRAITLEGTTE